MTDRRHDPLEWSGVLLCIDKNGDTHKPVRNIACGGPANGFRTPFWIIEDATQMNGGPVTYVTGPSP